MHAVELLEQAERVAQQVGYRLRHEWLDGNGGGACVFGGQKWIFIDLALNSSDQLNVVIEAIQGDPAAESAAAAGELRQLLLARKTTI